MNSLKLSPILTARGATYRIKGKIYKACVQSVLTYGTETWAMKKTNLQSLERTERMMVRWMCGVLLKDMKRSVDLYSLLGVQSVSEVVRRGRLRWFGHVERKSGDDWVSACRYVEVVGEKSVGRDRKTWREYRMTRIRLVCTLNGRCSGMFGEPSYRGKRLTLAERGRSGRFKNK